MLEDVFVACDQCLAPSHVDWFDIGLRVVLVAGLILGPYLIYRKNKGEKGLWEKKAAWWELIFFLLWIVVGIIIWYIRMPK